MQRKIILIIGVIVFALLAFGMLFPDLGDLPPPYGIRSLNTMRMLISALQIYKSDYGNFPQGKLGEITRILRGDNRDKVSYLDLGPSSLSPQGEPLDGWGTPFRLTIADEQVTVESAGKDKVFETSDDLKESR